MVTINTISIARERERAAKFAHVSEPMVLSGESFRISLNMFWLHDGFGVVQLNEVNCKRY